MKHKHADLIIAWANGAEIQFNTGDKWYDCIRNDPAWELNVEYRIKPEEMKPVVRWLWAIKFHNCSEWRQSNMFMDYKEITEEYPEATDFFKLEWSRTEFQNEMDHTLSKPS
jgi:hypothetical protein